MAKILGLDPSLTNNSPFFYTRNKLSFVYFKNGRNMIDFGTPPKGFVFYVIRLSDTHYYGGRTADAKARMQKHSRELRKGYHQNQHMVNVWNQHHQFDVTFTVYPDAESLLQAEQAWLDEHYGKEGCLNKSWCAEGGLPKGFKHSDETRQLMKDVWTEKGKDPEYRAKLSEAQKRRHRVNPMTAETRKKISESNKGKKRPDNVARNKAKTGWKHTDEAKEKIAEASRQMHKRKGKQVFSDEAIAKIKAARAKQVFTPEQIKKRSESLRRAWARRKAAKAEAEKKEKDQ